MKAERWADWILPALLGLVLALEFLPCLHNGFTNWDDDKLIVERIETIATNLAMERRFAKMGTEWYLIYYSGMNPMKKLIK